MKRFKALSAIKGTRSGSYWASILFFLIALMSMLSACAPKTEADPLDMKSVFPYFETVQGQRMWGLMAASGDVVLSAKYDSLDQGKYKDYFTGYLEDEAFIFNGRGEILLKTSQEEFYNAEEAFYQQRELVRTFYDATLQRYGYRQMDRVLLEPIFSNASEFVDGYALVQADGDETFSRVIDAAGNVILADPKVQLVNLGSGYIGAIEELYGFQTEYYKKRIVASYDKNQGSSYPESAYYTILPVANGNFFVYDGQYGRFVDDKGERVSGTPEVSGFNGFDLVGELVRAQGYSLDYINLAYYSPDGQLVWSNESSLEPYEVSDAITVTPQKPLLTLFQTYMPLKVSLPDFPQAEKEINQKTSTSPNVGSVAEEDLMTESTSFQISHFKNFIILTTEYFMYGIGAAHPNMALGHDHYDLKSNKWMQLSDFFVKPDDGLTAISDYIVREMTDQGTLQDYWIEDGLTIDPNHSFYLSKEGFNIVFQQYEIAPYAAGMPTFTIPYDVLKPLLNTEVESVADLLKSNE